jgi:tetratricopeptide (TPR) repeat protein
VPEATRILEDVIAHAAYEPDLHVYCLHKRATIARDNNDAPGALAYIQEAYRVHAVTPTQDGTLRANIVADLGYAYALNGRSIEAERQYEEATAILRRTGRDKSNIAFAVFNNWGVLSISTGQPEEALRHFKEAVDISRLFSPDGVPAPFLLGNRGTTLFSLARYEEAKRDLALMKKRASTDGNAVQATYADAVMADVAIAEGDLRRAEEVLRPYDPDSGYVAATTPAGLRILLVTAKLRMARGEYEQARTLFTQTIEGFVRGGTVVGGLARAYVERANLGLVDGHLDEALQDANRAVEVAEQTRAGDKPSNVLGLASLAQGRAYKARGDAAAATAALKVAVENLSRTVGAEHPQTKQAAEELRSAGKA